MPCRRASTGGLCYHALNRTNDRAPLFLRDQDYAAFLRIAEAGRERIGLRIPGYCLMPNHVHFVLWPRADGDMGRFFHYVLTTFSARRRRLGGPTGYLWQGRYRAFPIQQDEHFLTVLRYVERNPLRAGLVSRAQDWPWSSLGSRCGRKGVLSPDLPPLPLRPDWTAWVNEAQSAAELEALRGSVRKGTPYGGAGWVAGTVRELGLDSTRRGAGRPRKSATA